MAALGFASAGALTARMILRKDISAGTADAYGRRWEAFTSFCAENDWPSLPTTPAAVACFFGTLAERQLAPSTIRGYLTPVNSRHQAAGFPKPAVGELLARLRKGYARLLAEHDNAFPFARGPLPAPVLLRVVLLAMRTPDPKWRRRFTAVVLAFLVARRTSEVLELQKQDVHLRADGGVDLQVCRFKNGEARADPRRLAYVVPPSERPEPDVPLLLLRRMLRELAAPAIPPNRLIFSTSSLDRPPTCTDLTAWLGVALARLDVSPPPGVLWSSYSCRAGGATAMAVAGLARPAIAQMLGHAKNDPRTADAHYIDALAPYSVEALRLADRWCRPAPPARAA